MMFRFSGGIGFWGVAAALGLLVLVWCVCTAPWRQLARRPERLHAWLAGMVLMVLVWQLQVHVRGLLALHPLLMMACCVIFGPRLAVLGGVLATGLRLWLAGEAWALWPVQSLLNVMVPVAAATLILGIIERLPQRNLFVFLLGAGFFGAMLTVQAMALASVLYVWLLGPAPLLVMLLDHYYLTLLLMLPEGFVNGALITVLTVLKPDLVRMYDDRRYLQDP